MKPSPLHPLPDAAHDVGYCPVLNQQVEIKDTVRLRLSSTHIVFTAMHHVRYCLVFEGLSFTDSYIFTPLS